MARSLLWSTDVVTPDVRDVLVRNEDDRWWIDNGFGVNVLKRYFETRFEAVRLARTILPHVSDCDGLSIMVERLPAETITDVFAVRERARETGLDLLTWAGTVRERRVTTA